MARWNGTTTQRGYNGHHQTLRQQRLAAYRPGDVCANGGEPLNYPLPVRRGGKLISPYLDLPHNEARTGYLPGLSCRKHNRGDGAIRSNQGQPRLILARGGDTLCKTCGQPYHYAGRSCEICGTHYHPNHGAQRSCSRPCGVEIARRNRVARGWIPAAQRPKPPKPVKPPREPKNGWPSAALHHYTCRYCGKPGVTQRTPTPREVCASHPCQMRRLQANNWRARYGLSAEEADAAVLGGAPLIGSVRALRPGPIHLCPGCAAPAPAQFRWCDACLCTSRNSKGRRCGNRAGPDGPCDYHAEAASMSPTVTAASDGRMGAIQQAI